MEANQIPQAYDLSIWSSYKVVWKNQGTILKLLALPIVFYLVDITLSAYMDFSSMGDPNYNMKPKFTAGKVSLELFGGFLNIVGAAMMSVRLFRFYLADEDVNQAPFFAFGGRELRTFGYMLLFFIAAGIVLGALVGVPLFLEMSSLAMGMGIMGIIFVLYVSFRLTFIYADIALDRPARLSQSWGDMKGSVGLLFWKTLLAFLLYCALILTIIFGVAFVFFFFLPLFGFKDSAVTSLTIVVFILVCLVIFWALILFYGVVFRIMSNLYQRKVLNKA